MSESVACPNCGHTGEAGEFESHNEDFAPDLFGTFTCPECDHFWEDGDES